MYELYNGSERLLGALERRMDDAAALNELANILCYVPEQLSQDIQALLDRVHQEKENQE